MVGSRRLSEVCGTGVGLHENSCFVAGQPTWPDEWLVRPPPGRASCQDGFHEWSLRLSLATVRVYAPDFGDLGFRAIGRDCRCRTTLRRKEIHHDENQHQQA